MNMPTDLPMVLADILLQIRSLQLEEIVIELQYVQSPVFQADGYGEQFEKAFGDFDAHLRQIGCNSLRVFRFCAVDWGVGIVGEWEAWVKERLPDLDSRGVLSLTVDSNHR